MILPSRPLSLLSEGARSQMRQDGTGDTPGSRPSISLARRRRSSSWPHGLPRCASGRRWAKWSWAGRRVSGWRPRRTRRGNACVIASGRLRQVLHCHDCHLHSHADQAADCMAVLRSSFMNDRMKIPTMYVTLSNVSAVAKPALSMR
jgi:hypothetical protein